MTENKSYSGRQEAACLAFVIVVGVLATIRFWGDYQLFGHSADFDYFRQASFHRCIKGGIWYPRWLPDSNFGYGSLLFHFYSPLSYYFTEIFMLVGFTCHTALKLTMAFALILSGLTAYLFCRDFSSPPTAALAGVAYMLAPYHLVDMLVRHTLGEHFAFIWIPLAAWGLTGMIMGRRWIRLPAGAIGLAALILTHNISAMLGMGALMIWWGVLMFQARNWRSGVWGAATLAAGLGLAAFFWIPALAHKRYVYAGACMTRGYFSYEKHFVEPYQLVEPSWGYGASNEGTADDDMSFQIGIPHWLFFLAGLTYVLRCIKRRQRGPAFAASVFGLILFVVAVFFTLPMSEHAYQWLPMVSLVQFPWRFLQLATFAGSVLVISIEPLTAGRQNRTAFVLTLGLSAMLMAILYGPYTRPGAHIFSKKERGFVMRPVENLKAIKDPVYDAHVWEMGGLSFFREYGKSGTCLDEFLPITVPRKELPTREPAVEAAWMGPGKHTIAINKENPVDLTVQVTADTPGEVHFARFHFQGWRATVNGHPAPAVAHPASGIIVVPVPAGTSQVTVAFGFTSFQWAMAIISLLSLCAVALYAMRAFKGNHGRTGFNIGDNEAEVKEEASTESA